MIKNFGLDIEPIYEDARPGDAMFAHADVSKAKEILNFRASQDLKTELKNMFTWIINSVRWNYSQVVIF